MAAETFSHRWFLLVFLHFLTRDLVAASMPRPSSVHCLLCDIDGSLVHYENELLKHGTISMDNSTGIISYASLGDSEEMGPENPTEAAMTTSSTMTTILRALPPSSTGMQAYISQKTLDIAASIGKAVPIGIISGGRWSTVKKRMPYLPRANAIVSDNGGRIFWRRGYDGGDSSEDILEEDATWRRRIISESAGAIGDMQEDGLAPEHRQGALWDLYRRLTAEGWHCDAEGYATSFRIRLDEGATGPQEREGDVLPLASSSDCFDARRLWERTAPFNGGGGGLTSMGLSCSVNLGLVDVFPVGSGKQAAGLYVVERLGATPEATAFLCDDDNDVALATSVGLALVPQCTSESMRRASIEAAQDPSASHEQVAGEGKGSAIVVASIGGCFGTEESLQYVAKMCVGSRSRSHNQASSDCYVAETNTSAYTTSHIYSPHAAKF